MIAAVAACTAAVAVAGSATAAGPGAGQADRADGPQVRALSCHNYRIVIGYDGEPLTKKDWYGVYRGRIDPRDWSRNLFEGQWEWARNGDTRVTEFLRGEDLHAAYWTVVREEHDGEHVDRYALLSSGSLEDIHCDD